MNTTSPWNRAERIARVIAALRDRLGDRLATGQAVRDQHGHGEAYFEVMAPDAVAWPLSTEEVAFVVGACHEYQVPVIPFGAGTSLEGHVAAVAGGITIDLSRMDRVLAVHAEDFDVVVQPGVTREALDAHLRETGLFFPVDPGANATLGGMISTRASGTTTVRYGGIAQNILALQVVLGDGSVIRCGTRARKSSAGYDLVRMFCGAEGTLGVITEATLRLHGRPEAIGSAVVPFPTLRGAVRSVIELSQSGAPLSRIEFLDEVQVRACNAYSKLALPEMPTLFLEFDGTEAAVREQFERAAEIVKANGAPTIEWAFDEAERARLWKARHSAYFAARASRPGTEAVVADVCVPISALADCVAAARERIDAEKLVATIVGHVGDGNFHVVFLIDPKDPSEREAMDRVYDAMIADAHRAGGTCTGEHGIGIGKQTKLLAEFGEPVIDLMRALKRAWDPAGILNPGKVFSDA